MYWELSASGEYVGKALMPVWAEAKARASSAGVSYCVGWSWRRGSASGRISLVRYRGMVRVTDCIVDPADLGVEVLADIYRLGDRGVDLAGEDGGPGCEVVFLVLR
jgi:hypothetical protein